MKLDGENIYVKFAEECEAEAMLKLEVDNRDFFQAFTGLRDESFYTYDGQVKRIKKAAELRKEDQDYFFVICSRESGEVIGEVHLFDVIRGNIQSCWIGYFLDKEQNGKGYMSEAVKLVVDYAFSQLKFHRIEAGVMPHNIGSIKVLLKAGFHKEGLAKKNVKINGRWEDHQTLAIINPEDEEN
ncbi:GNAT family N-acetyltransferase [Bacillus manliponensis]|uniref:GNAT family N-acetyltransferase n=1 Tax=Bacillus manliponensis TaxID=574376 RepID=UPI0005592A59|nr:GNAT family N-acetyltransferase [Bacillus manliponensis]